MKDFRTLNNAGGWLCFLIAFLTYVSTMEATVSYWDTGEFIASIYRLEVPHQPGAPLFLMIYKLFSLPAGADGSAVAWFTNLTSALASAFTVLFLFWTITALARRIIPLSSGEFSSGELSSGEAPFGTPSRKKPVHGISASGTDASGADASGTNSPGTTAGPRTLLILGCGCTGALAYTFSDTFWFSAVETEVYALSSLLSAVTFWAILKWDTATKAEKPFSNRWLLLIAYLVGLSTGVHLLNLLSIPAIVLLWYFRRYPYSPKGLAVALSAGTGLLLLVQYGIIPGSIALAARMELLLVNGIGLPFHSGLWAFVLLLAGGITWGLYRTARRGKVALNTALLCLAYIYIGFSSYTVILLRAQAGPSINISRPDNAFSLLNYLSRGQYLQQPLLTGPDFSSEALAVEESARPELTGYRPGKNRYRPGQRGQEVRYDHTSFFPRIWYAGNEDFYRSWLGLSENERPDFADNLRFFFTYQVGHLYWRYFMWNFAGRVNDMQGNYKGTLDGNWISGIKPLDELRLGSTGRLPERVTENKAYNRLFCLPLLLGLAGLAYQYRKGRKDFIVILTLFLFTGLAIIVYLNQYPLQPRERDYTFAGSFYAFAIWIGLGVAGVQQLLSSVLRRRAATGAAVSACLLAVPLLMAIQEWDDHDRSGRTFARDMAYNYLAGLDRNAILITNADNNTYPLWYLQEVEGVRPDVRVAIYQFFGSESYVEQLKRPVNDSAPLPLTAGLNSYGEGAPNWLPIVDKGLKEAVELKEAVAFAFSEGPAYKMPSAKGEPLNYFPANRFSIHVDREKALASGAASPGEALPEAVEWNYPGSYVGKPDLIQLDLYAHQDWTRPVYLAGTSAPTVTLGLDDYYRNEGMAVRLTPVKNTDATPESGFRTGIEQLYDNLMHRYRWTGLRNEHLYVDSETVRMVNYYRTQFSELALASFEAGQPDTCLAVLDRMREVLPPRFERPGAPVHNINTLPYIRMAGLYYECGQPAGGDQLMEEARAFIADSLDYYASLSPARRRVYDQDIRIGMFAMEQMKSIAVAQRRESLLRKLTPAYDSYRARFGI